MIAADDAVLALLNGITGVTICDSFVESDADTKVVTYPVPYAVFYSSVGDDSRPRLAGRNIRRSVFFSITYVGLSREQAKWAGEAVRAAIEGHRVTVVGHSQVGLIQLLESQRVRRDDDAIRPDGSPLFYGVDNYAIPINIVRN